MSAVPGQDREAEIDGSSSLERPGRLDPLHSFDSGSELIGVLASHLVIRVHEREEPPGEPPLVR
jgi:hypothetical protein